MLFKIDEGCRQFRADLNDDPGEGARGEGDEELGKFASSGLVAVGGGAENELGTESGFERKDAEEHWGMAELDGEMSVSPSWQLGWPGELNEVRSAERKYQQNPAMPTEAARGGVKEMRLPQSAMDGAAVEAIRRWLTGTVQEGMRVLVIGGPSGGAKRQHVLAGICGDGARPVPRPATALASDTTGTYDFSIRRGMAEIDFGMFAGAHRKSATVTTIGACEALRHQPRGSMPPVLVFRNHQTARRECVLSALNCAAEQLRHVVVLTERPTAACQIASAWEVSLLVLPVLSGVQRQRAVSCGYRLLTGHDKKAETLTEAAVTLLTAPGVRSVPGLRKLAAELIRDQHDSGMLAMMILSKLEGRGAVPAPALCHAVQLLMKGLEDGYRLHLHWERFLVFLAIQAR